MHVCSVFVVIIGSSAVGYETSISIRQTWEQEPQGYDRQALVKVPPTSAGKKWPVVVDLHGAGGSANLRRLSDISDAFVIVAASWSYIFSSAQFFLCMLHIAVELVEYGYLCFNLFIIGQNIEMCVVIIVVEWLKM